MASKADMGRYRDNLKDERDSAALYEQLAAAEPNATLAGVYRRLAEVERRHAEVWADKLREEGETLPVDRPTWRTRLLGWLAQRFGASLVLPTIADLEHSASAAYDDQPEAQMLNMPQEERSHARVFGYLTRFTPGLEGSAIARLEGRHRSTGGNALRAGVLGANDGLVSNLSLVMGVAGADLSSGGILVTGLAGLLAGALSMALGEWLSVQSSRELYQRQLRIEKQELLTAPDEEKEELALIYQAKGVKPDEAQRLAEKLLSDEATALDTLAREELNINPEELGGSAWEAALTSFFLFAIGAIVPVLPYFFSSGYTAVILSGLLSGVGLFVIGAGITLMTGRGLLFSGGRQILFGLLAAGITFGIGRLVGVNIGG